MLNNVYSMLHYSQGEISLRGCLAAAAYVECQEVMMPSKIYAKELLKIMGNFIYSK